MGSACGAVAARRAAGTKGMPSARGDGFCLRGHGGPPGGGPGKGAVYVRPEREGRAVSQEDVEHYCRIVAPIRETIRLMGKIDVRGEVA